MSSQVGGAVASLEPSRAAAPGKRAEEGYTLIELLVVSMVVPLVVGALAIGLVSVLTLQGGTSKHISASTDAQVVSANFEQDVQSSANLTTSATATQCGTGTQLLGLEWNLNKQTSAYQVVVSYVEVKRGATYSLVRQYCASGISSTPTISSIISRDIPTAQSPPTIAPSGSNTAASTGWISTVPITGVTFATTQPGSNYSYTLVALPRSSSSGQQSAVTPPTTSCGFATSGTGTYASTLCFVDFTSYSASTVSPGCPSNGQRMSAAITSTPYSLTFCLSVSGGSVAGAPIPTYFAPPTSEAYLGNNGFYTGIPGNPALYQANQSTNTTITITQIQVLDSNGNAATGWELVTGDAESTDSGESITWTSNQALSLLPDSLGGSQASDIGNACAYSPAPSGTLYPGTWLTGIGTTTVKCAASVSSDKTGTVMLQAPGPTSLTIQMVGAGLQAIFLGVLLP